MQIMKTALACGGKILVVGDGDFSFTVAMVKHCDLLRGNLIFTSNLETVETISHHAQASQNMSFLNDSGVLVFLDTDARDLHNHAVIGKEKFDRIIFNFPLVDRHNIKKNRALLADFFLSCKSVLAVQGQILVTLCKGQGGTPADEPMRSWHDSWQIVAMATNAGFLLSQVLPFDPLEFPEYHSVGFRFQDKSFNVSGAMTHVFEEGAMVEDWDQNIRGSMATEEGETYSCSSYVASSFQRNLLLEPRNPVCILNQLLEHSFTQKEPCLVTADNVCNPVILSHKSAAYFYHQQDVPSHSIVATEAAKGDKDWKNSENMKRMHKAEQLKHGVAESESKGDKDGALMNGNGCSNVAFTSFLPKREESVYILVKTQRKAGVKFEEDMDSATMGESEASSVTMNKKMDQPLCQDQDENCAEGNDRLQFKDSDIDEPLVYHCRTSLLENLPHLCHFLRESSSSDDSNTNLSTNFSSSSSQSSVHQSTQDVNLASLGLSVSSQSHVSASCLLASGQCLIPNSIVPGTIPLKHELLILHELFTNSQISAQDQFEQLSSKMLSILQTVCSPCCSSSLSSRANVSLALCDPGRKINIESMDETQLVCQFVYCGEDESEEINAAKKGFLLSKNFGFILKSRIGNSVYHITLINLDCLVCHLCGIEDQRLLLSKDPKFLDQFCRDLPTCKYHPFSLYPLKFVHDLSFWEKEDDSEKSFDVSGLYEVIRNVAGDLVTNVSLVDIYHDPKTNKRSRCYRLFFVSYDKCLPYVMSWRLQSQIRIEVAKRLGVQLR